MSHLRAPKRNYLQAQSIAQLKLCSNPPSPSPPFPSPPSPQPPRVIENDCFLKIKKRECYEIFVGFYAMIVIFQCLSLSL